MRSASLWQSVQYLSIVARAVAVCSASLGPEVQAASASAAATAMPTGARTRARLGVRCVETGMTVAEPIVDLPRCPLRADLLAEVTVGLVPTVIRSAEPERIVARQGARAKGLAEAGIVRFVRTDASRGR